MSKLIQKYNPATGKNELGKINSDELNDGIADKNFYFEQTAPASEWVISHPLNKVPSLTTFDSSGNKVYGDEYNIDAHTVRVVFAYAFSGYAYLN